MPCNAFVSSSSVQRSHCMVQNGHSVQIVHSKLRQMTNWCLYCTNQTNYTTRRTLIVRHRSPKRHTLVTLTLSRVTGLYGF